MLISYNLKKKQWNSDTVKVYIWFNISKIYYWKKKTLFFSTNNKLKEKSACKFYYDNL